MERTMKNNIFAAVFCVFLLLAGSFGVSAQKKAAANEAIRFTVVDASGVAVAGAEVSIGEGSGHYLSDESGTVSISCSLRDQVTVSKEGYKSVTIRAGVLVDSDSVVLVPDILFAGQGDDVRLPYTSVKKRYSVGSTVTIKGEDLARYSSADIRNVLTGVLPGVEVRENYGQIGVTPLEHTGQYGASTAIAVTSRGTQVMYVVDDVPVQLNEIPLDPEQIESVTIIRDGLEKTMYGPTAANGIVYIRTKSGAYNDRYLNVNFESGVNVVDRMPGFANASQYALLNNIARNNSGLPMLYTREAVNGYQRNDAFSLTYPSVDFRSRMLKNTMSYTRAGVSSGGGNDIVKYYAYLGYTGQDDIYKIGPDSGYDNINLNGNLDVSLNRYFRAAFGIISSIGVRKSNNYGYGTDAGFVELPEILGHITTIPQNAFPIYADNSEELEFPYYAVTSKYTQNPIANILENGSYSETIRGALFNFKLDGDLGFLAKGLRSETYAAFGATNLVRLGQAEDYAAYILTEGLDENGDPVIVPVQSSSHSVVQVSSKSKILDYYSNRFYFTERLDYARNFGLHDLDLSADFMITQRNQKFITEHRREMNFGFNARYSYAGKYLAQLALNEHGTYSLLDIWSFSPSAGFGWILSEEPFLKDSRTIDFLKLRIQGGVLHYDSLTSANRDVDNYSWNNSGQKFGPYTTNQWFGNNTSANVNRTYASMLGNPNLRLETRKEISGGVDLTAFGKRLDVSLNAYAFLQDGIITQMANAVPLVAGTSTGSFYMNYNSYLRRGLELSASWKDRLGAVSYGVSGWVAMQKSTIRKIDELDYAESYRSRVGKSVTAIWGLKYLGQFESDAETLEVPQLYDDALKAGDFKYQDMNGDGYIDSSDQCVIGDSNPALIGALNLNLGWKNFDFSLTGTFRAFYDILCSNSYFWNGWGDNNYSNYVLKNIANPKAPRLTYNKVNNNFVSSEYWLADGGFFKIQSAEIGYNLPLGTKGLGSVVRAMRIWCRANNLFTITGLDDVDPEAVDSGLTNYPLMRTFTGGLKLTF